MRPRPANRLGGALCGLGFEKTWSYIHGSQGCVAYFRTYFNRHFKEPIAFIADSMTEDAAVFGGQKNVHEGLQNATKLYDAKMIAVCTTCIAEVIGDDLGAFIGNARKEGYVDKDFPIPYANTPSFVGSHIAERDNMFEGIMRYFTLNTMEGKAPGQNGKINIVPGFETYLGNYRVIKRYLSEMGVDYTYLCDPSEVAIRRPPAPMKCMPAAGDRRGEGCAQRHHHVHAAIDDARKEQEVHREHLES